MAEAIKSELDQTDQQDWTIDELICVCMARRIADGDVVALGLATPLPAAAAVLAQRTHAPNMFFASAIGQAFCQGGPALGLTTAEGNWLDAALNTNGFVQAAADYLPRARPKEFFRPGQVDPHGNFNNLAFGRDLRRPRLRMPGVGGIPDVSVFMGQVELYVPRHSRVTFVEELDWQTGMGHHPQRRRGDGPRWLVSNLGQFDFADGRMRLVSVHPGVEPDWVQRKTGFDLEIAEPLVETEPPSLDELQALRQQADPFGLRRLEMLSGAERRQALREIIQAEARDETPQAGS